MDGEKNEVAVFVAASKRSIGCAWWSKVCLELPHVALWSLRYGCRGRRAQRKSLDEAHPQAAGAAQRPRAEAGDGRGAAARRPRAARLSLRQVVAFTFLRSIMNFPYGRLLGRSGTPYLVIAQVQIFVRLCVRPDRRRRRRSGHGVFVFDPCAAPPQPCEFLRVFEFCFSFSW